MKKETESTIKTVQDQALCARNLRNAVYIENVESICCVCSTADETVAHIFSECSKLVQKGYRQVRHDSVAKMLHWNLREKWGFNKAEKWYIHKPQKRLESANSKILWDFPIQIDKTVGYNRPDIIVIDKKSEKCILIDPACSFDTRIEKKEEEKCTNYSEVKYEIAKMWKMKKTEVNSVVIGALETVTKHFEKWIEKLDLERRE